MDDDVYGKFGSVKLEGWDHECRECECREYTRVGKNVQCGQGLVRMCGRKYTRVGKMAQLIKDCRPSKRSLK